MSSKEKLKNLCRACCRASDYMTPIFSPVFRSNIPDKMAYCTGLQIESDDGKPNQLCQCCLDNLHIAYAFKKMCRQNDKTFYSTYYGIKYNVRIKVERINIEKHIATKKDQKIEIEVPAVKTELIDEVPVIKLDDDDDDHFNDNGHDQDDFIQKCSGNENKNESIVTNNDKEIAILANGNENDDDDFTWREDETLMSVLESSDVKVNPKPAAKRNKVRKYMKIRKDKGGKHKKRSQEEREREKLKRLAKPRKIRCGKLVQVRYCHSCDISFDTTEACDEHKRRVHGPKTESLICEVCGKSYKGRGSYHERSHYPPAFACPREPCAYKAHTKAILKKHLKIHDEGPRVWWCALCARSFATCSSLRSHERSLHAAARPHPCPHCPKAFSTKTKLEIHVRIHTQDRPYVCPHCPAAFSRRDVWRGHLQRQHGEQLPRARPGAKRNRVVDVDRLKDAAAALGAPNEASTEIRSVGEDKIPTDLLETSAEMRSVRGNKLPSDIFDTATDMRVVRRDEVAPDDTETVIEEEIIEVFSHDSDYINTVDIEYVEE